MRQHERATARTRGRFHGGVGQTLYCARCGVALRVSANAHVNMYYPTAMHQRPPIPQEVAALRTPYVHGSRAPAVNVIIAFNQNVRTVGIYFLGPTARCATEFRVHAKSKQPSARRVYLFYKEEE